jgi:hypothetical protein
MLEAATRDGHIAFIADYIQEICGDPHISSSISEDVSVLDGALAAEWLVSTAAALRADLERVLKSESGLPDDTHISEALNASKVLLLAHRSMLSSSLKVQGLTTGVLRGMESMPSTHHSHVMPLAFDMG